MNAIVTGSTKGIGRALVFGLLKEGWDVAVTSRTQEDLENLQKEAKALFPDRICLIHAVDFSKKENTTAYAKTMESTWSEIDLLVNNVGIFFPGAVHQESDGILESTMDLNLFSPYHLTRALLPRMMNRNA